MTTTIPDPATTLQTLHAPDRFDSDPRMTYRRVTSRSLLGHALDWAVLYCATPAAHRKYTRVFILPGGIYHSTGRDTSPQGLYDPTTNPQYAMPLIEYSKISTQWDRESNQWLATADGCGLNPAPPQAFGAHMTTAALRVFVTLHAGAYIEIPEVLANRYNYV